MSLHEIRKHNQFEIMTMLKALERLNVIEQGTQLMSIPDKERAEMMRNDYRLVELKQLYEGELFLYKLYLKRNNITEE